MKKGFTLMELLIVMVIVTVLVTIAVPKYKGAMERGRGLQAIASAQALSDKLNAIYVMNGNTYGSDSELPNLASKVKNLGGYTNTDFFTYEVQVFTPNIIKVQGVRRNLSDKGYTVLYVNQNGEVSHRYCLGYQPYCKLLGASVPADTSSGAGWEFK